MAYLVQLIKAEGAGFVETISNWHSIRVRAS